MSHTRHRVPAAVLALVAAAPLVFAWACKPKSSNPISARPDPSANMADAPDGSVAASTSAPTSSASSEPAVAALTPSSSSSVAASASAGFDCDRIFKAMQVGADAVLRKHSACLTDADCVTVSGRVCIGACDTAINKSGAADHERAMRAAQPQCDRFMKSSCLYTYPVPVPTCPMMFPRCENGTCGAKRY